MQILVILQPIKVVDRFKTELYHAHIKWKIIELDHHTEQKSKLGKKERRPKE